MLHEIDGGIEWHGGHQVVRVEPWGADSVRVRAGLSRLRSDIPGALGDRPASEAKIRIDDDSGAPTARLVNGEITAEVGDDGMLRFVRTATGAELLAERRAHFWWPGPRVFSSTGNGYYRIEQRFAAYAGERVFGLGQHTHGLLDQKGAVIDLVQRNAEVTIPFLFSSRGYGLLWNSPAVGRVELAGNGTRWVADSARQIDYWVTTGPDPAAVLDHYSAATGRAPMLPEWASGFWQSKLRYKTQEELLEVAREYKRRGLPLSVIVSDFFHWTHLGDWRFDPAEWPDPAAMVRELREMGTELMVSVWPSVSPLSENYDEMLRQGLLVATEQGPPVHADWADKGVAAKVQVSFYDATNPRARAYVWDKARRNYLDLGVRVWWLDACEPEIKPGHQENLRYHAGPGAEVGNIYPAEHARGFYEGMREAGETDVITLCRSAWAGSQRYGAALWSGDIAATFASLRAQIRAGLNVAMSGIPWWTTDIGGFHGGDQESPEYRELLVRWFQYGVFCPLLRLHGFREPFVDELHPQMSGGPNEVWSYGEEVYGHLRELLFLRERLRPYVMEQMRAAHERGLPPMRPLFVDFPDDDRAWAVEDAFLFGPDVLVAPVTEYGAREREVYLPAGARWRDPWTGEVHAGGAVIRLAAPLERAPVLVREGADVPIAGSAPKSAR
ncbi:TIM-barrel domain-containing protein [Streptomonospora nanhaiensis]|uniref:Alpha-D-xyloside xylohydrolase n=1 Tax=Streptomonospora nanhaiensis TaxID=1323731 RepID=A0A853BM00_9ACTN|nr:glycoside hydrolase family 31 protein [Streptomonospora nanhaiensis]MBX9388636.1 glycoside hydrolase family 31 protein [Streptomonospora nanhaiensis]NYI96253.1 alpha-D-xyloside xylohydrolase [Streptomonospora nanhaiensis]